LLAEKNFTTIPRKSTAGQAEHKGKTFFVFCGKHSKIHGHIRREINPPAQNTKFAEAD
jgi:hypothetical protein